jgi:hypothetical protein
MKFRSIFSAFLLSMAAGYVPSAAGFSVLPPSNRHLSSSSSVSALGMTVLTYGTKKKDFKPGTPLSKAVEQLGVKPRYSCKK